MIVCFLFKSKVFVCCCCKRGGGGWWWLIFLFAFYFSRGWLDANGETENITRKKRERIQTIAAAPCRPTQLRGKRGASSSSSVLVLEGHIKKGGGEEE